MDVVAWFAAPPRVQLVGLDLPAGSTWLDFLAAHAAGQPWPLLLGRDDGPRVSTDAASPSQCAIVHLGTLRGYAPILRTARGVEGVVVVVAAGALTPVTVAGPITWFRGWRSPWWTVPKGAPGDRGHVPGDELPFPAWATDGLGPEEVVIAKDLLRARRAPPAAAPPPATPAPTPAPRRPTFTAPPFEVHRQPPPPAPRPPVIAKAPAPAPAIDEPTKQRTLF